MPENKDIFGIKPYGDALKLFVEKSLKGSGEFLGKLCLPATEELGLMAHDQIKYWRLSNFIRILSKAKGKIEIDPELEKLKLHPRIGIELLEDGSKEDRDEIQDLWAGILISSLSKGGKDDSSLLYLNILKQLSGPEINLLNYTCLNSKMKKDRNNLIYSERFVLPLDELKQITKLNHAHEIDRILDHMRSLELFAGFGGGSGGGFALDSPKLLAEANPSTLAINLYVRCKGWKSDPCDFFKLNE